MTPYERILLAVDFTPDASHLVQRVRALAQVSDAALHLIHVVEHIPVDAAGEFLGPPQAEFHEDLVAQARERLAHFAETEGLGQAHQHVSVGYTKQEILDRAETLAADLIVVGSHGRHGLALLLGSTANAVLHGAPCDVLAVRLR